jgi:hypothetical protein
MTVIVVSSFLAMLAAEAARHSPQCIRRAKHPKIVAAKINSS